MNKTHDFGNEAEQILMTESALLFNKKGEVYENLILGLSFGEAAPMTVATDPSGSSL